MNNNNKKFDKKEYDRQYKKENFKQIAFRYRSDGIDYIKEFAKNRNLSVSKAIIAAFKYIDTNNITLDAESDI